MSYKQIEALRKVRATDFSRLEYRGYVIRRNDLSGQFVVDKDGRPVCYPLCWGDARQQIDAMLDG